MTKVFVAGSIKIKKLHPSFVERISKLVSKNMHVLLGDANGVDSSVQQELFLRKANNVIIYCATPKPRNNIGKWEKNHVHSTAKPGTRAFFTAKDIQMAHDADYGLMLWDASSTGTLNNIIELIKHDKKCVVFINKEQIFMNIKKPDDINGLITFMSDGARAQAEKKINLKSKIFEITNQQFGLAV